MNWKRTVFLALIVILFNTNVYAGDRALWVWGMSGDIVLEKHPEDRSDFFSFINAPHGNQNAKINVVFMSIDPYIIEKFPSKVREFISDAHSRGLEIHLLTGDKTWSFTVNNPTTQEPYNKPAMDLLDLIFAYNSASKPNQRFDAIQYDIEPYTISATDNIINPETGQPFVWNTDIEIIWPQYIDSLEMIKNKIDEFNNDGDYTNNLFFGAAIPRWYIDSDTAIPNHRQIQDTTDYIAVMNYNVRSTATDDIRSEIAYADSKGYTGSVYCGYETIEVCWREWTEIDTETGEPGNPFYFYNYYYNLQTSFWAFGNADLEDMVLAIENTYGANTSFKGHAIHYYEDIRNSEYSYRNLGLAKTIRRAPVCYVISPSGGEILTGSGQLEYKAHDLDNDYISIRIYISTDGETWTDIFNVIPVSDPVEMGNGIFKLDISDLPEGNYKIKVSAQEISGTLSGYDISDDFFKVYAQKEDFSAPVHSPSGSINVAQPERDNESIYSPDKAFIQWDGFTDTETEQKSGGIKGYFYSASPQISNAKFTTADCGYIYAQPGEYTCYVWAQDYSGNISEPLSSNIIIFPDLDNDGIVDIHDTDIDGDGISNSDETNYFFTNPENPLSYSWKKHIDIYEFDNADLNNILSSGYNLFKESGNTITYLNSNRFYDGDRYLNYTAIQPDPPLHLRIDNALSNNAFSIQMWIKPDNYLYDNNYHIPLVFVGDVDYGISLFLQHKLQHYIQLRIYNGGNPGVSKYSSIIFPNEQVFDENWHHIAFSYNRYDKCLKLYLDGKLIGTKRNVCIPESISSLTPIRFFDANSMHDFTYITKRYNKLIENSAQLAYIDKVSQQIWNLYSDKECRYIGGVDDIRISHHAVHISELGWYTHPVPDITDTDGDGISDLKEKIICRTNPQNPDTDGDKIKDGAELYVGSDPLDPLSVLAITSAKKEPASDKFQIQWTDFSSDCSNYYVDVKINNSDWIPVAINPETVEKIKDGYLNKFSWIDPDSSNNSGESESRKYRIVYSPIH